MRKIILLVLMLMSCTTFAAADCRVIEYPDHNEVSCDGDAETPRASSQQTEQEQKEASAQPTEFEQQDVPPELIVRNELAILHAAAWLRTTSVH